MFVFVCHRCCFFIVGLLSVVIAVVCYCCLLVIVVVSLLLVTCFLFSPVPLRHFVEETQRSLPLTSSPTGTDDGVVAELAQQHAILSHEAKPSEEEAYHKNQSLQ